MKIKTLIILGVFVVGLCGLAAYQGFYEPAESVPLYLDSNHPVDQRVEDLLARMTLEEKVGQINMPCVYVGGLGRDIAAKMEGCRKFARGKLVEGIGPSGGFFTLANTILQEGPLQQANFFNELQKIAVEETRLGIPLLETEEGTHGLMSSGATIFPEGPALGSMWNLDLIEKIYAAAAEEARSVGIHQLFTLVIEPNRDPRLGRNEEGYSEDPYLSAEYARAIVNAVQGDDLTAGDKTVAGLCHYPGQSQPVSGLERGDMDISERVLREVFLPPWVAGIKEAGARGVMATYPAILGVPVHASSEILTDLLRDELGFEGLVLSEGGGIGTIIYYGLADSQEGAGALALDAGVDVGISFERAYLQAMKTNVEEGSVPMETLDRSVRRILQLKFELGLFENPYVNPERAVDIFHSEEHQDLALQAARESIVLLKNENDLLPLNKNLASVAVIGPNADHIKNQLGDYTAGTILQDVVTVLDGIRKIVSPDTRITYVRGCDVIKTEDHEIPEAVRVAEEADVAVVVVGENEWNTPNDECTVGEACDVASLNLTGRQEELARAIHATGTPTVVVLVNGRPLSIPWIAEHVPVVVESWLSGEKGGQAVAEVLFGDVNPSGRLPVTFPRHVGQLPVYYNYKPSKSYWIENGWRDAYADMSPYPLYEFGFGLSYTTFDYSNPRISRDTIPPDGKVEVSIDVTNTGSRQGDEVVQLYIQDEIASVVMPVKQLKGFKKISLEPGQTSTVTFLLEAGHLSLLDRDMNWIVEPGRFIVLIGRSSEDIKAELSFDVID